MGIYLLIDQFLEQEKRPHTKPSAHATVFFYLEPKDVFFFSKAVLGSVLLLGPSRTSPEVCICQVLQRGRIFKKTRSGKIIEHYGS